MRESKLSLLFAGDRVQCPFCQGRFKKFLPFGFNTPASKENKIVGMGYRSDAMCPRCLSLDRERLVYLYLKHKTGVFREKVNLLHVAPELNLQRVLENSPNIDYVSADLGAPLASVRMDVTKIMFEDNTFDVIICNHVLEHVLDDRKAMSELYRILRPGGWAVMQVPISMSLERTYEDSEVVNPKERERLFGQHDHVRIYARDYADRLERAGFSVEIYNLTEEMGESFSERYGLIKEESLYVCSKPAEGSQKTLAEG